MEKGTQIMSFTLFLKEILEECAFIAQNSFGKVTASTKANDNNQVLTATDLQIGQTIIAAVQKKFPEHNIIDEEAGVIDKQSRFTWIIDPIDGTSNFANGLPHYGIMIGLLENNVPIVGGIALPFFKEIYTAEKGKGTWCNNVRLAVTTESNLTSCLVAYGIDGHQENPQLTRREVQILGKIVLGIRNLRSSNSVFDVAMVLKGKYGAVLNQTSKIWDNVAQHILIEEAGGKYTDFTGLSMNYSTLFAKADQNFTFCAAAPQLHEQLQTIIHATM